MKKIPKWGIICFSAAIVAVFAWLLFFRAGFVPDRIKVQSAEKEGDSMERQDTSLSDKGMPRSPINALGRLKLSTATDAKNAPIRFWGKILDENDSPIMGAHVRAEIRGWNVGLTGNPKSGFTTVEGVSGPDGRFELHGGRGDVLTIRAIEKVGYEADPSALRWFGYHISENITADPNNPIVLRLWRIDTRQVLVVGEKKFRIIPDGRLYTFDLLKGTATNSPAVIGDLRLAITRPLDIKPSERFDWSFQLAAIEGGILRENDKHSSMYLAPENNYAPQFIYSKDKEKEGWGNGFSGRFYVKSRKGNITARVEVELNATHPSVSDAGWVSLRYAVNPNGSHILRP